MTRVESWSDIRVGTPVVVRRADGSSFETRTASRAFEMPGGAAVVRVVSLDAQDYYALDRVSLAGNEPRPVARVPLALALDPPPDGAWTTGERVLAVAFAVGGIYVLGSVLALVFG